LENEEVNMTSHECRYCQGELEAKLVTRVQAYEGQWFVIENLPALVCKQCGETYFTPEAHDRVVHLITSNAPPTRNETVAVYDAAKAS
jgi:YgiT-type zinc finger domain-containing protein